jgi:hypothetical protein
MYTEFWRPSKILIADLKLAFKTELRRRLDFFESRKSIFLFFNEMRVFFAWIYTRNLIRNARYAKNIRLLAYVWTNISCKISYKNFYKKDTIQEKYKITYVFCETSCISMISQFL